MTRNDSTIQYVIADASHDAAIRTLLRESSMEGDISISLKREPSYFAAAKIGCYETHTIVAFQGDQAVCMGSISIADRFINGSAERVGYLGQLRLATSHAGRFDIVRRGYQLFKELHQKLKLPIYFTSVASDNHRAIRLLERGLPGFPKYHNVGELVTLTIARSRGYLACSEPSAPVRRRLRESGLQTRHGLPSDRDAIVSLLNAQSRQFQFAPHASTAELDAAVASSGLCYEHFRLLCDNDQLVGCAALWDQRLLKQVVVSRYSRRLAWTRGFYNIFASITNRVRLPRPGSILSQAFISHVSNFPEFPEQLAELIYLLMAPARTLGLTMLMLGLDARDPRLPFLVKQFKPRLYRTRVYTVSWEDETALQTVDNRLMYPEVAFL